jgi:pimeloyl-[acyl-carrier protein] methyl ester esterase
MLNTRVIAGTTMADTLHSTQSMTLVLLPGMEGTGTLFAPFSRALPDRVKPVVVSYPTDRPLDYAGHLKIVMAALPLDEPFFLLGESFSGPLALMAAAQHPRGLMGVILCATFVTWPLPVARSVARLIVSCGLFRLKSTRLFLRILLSRSAPDELRTLFAEALADLEPEVLAARARAIMKVDCTAELRQCPVPVLTMVADHDRILPERCSELIHHVRPDAEIVHFKTPHLILQCAPATAAGLICGFMDAVMAKAEHDSCS